MNDKVASAIAAADRPLIRRIVAVQGKQHQEIVAAQQKEIADLKREIAKIRGAVAKATANAADAITAALSAPEWVVIRWKDHFEREDGTLVLDCVTTLWHVLFSDDPPTPDEGTRARLGELFASIALHGLKLECFLCSGTRARCTCCPEHRLTEPWPGCPSCHPPAERSEFAEVAR